MFNSDLSWRDLLSIKKGYEKLAKTGKFLIFIGLNIFKSTIKRGAIVHYNRKSHNNKLNSRTISLTSRLSHFISTQTYYNVNVSEKKLNNLF